MRAVSLPVTRAARRVRERTAFATAVRRLWQIASAVAAICVVVLFFAYVLLYYAEVAPNGAIRLHHGTKWLAPVFRFLPALRVETGLSAADLTDEAAARYRLQAGAAAGFWTHTSMNGYRAWYDNIRPSLNALSSARVDVLVGAGAVPPVLRLGEESRPSEIAFAAWALLDGSDDHQLNTLLAHILGADRTSPLITPFSPNELDFDIVDRSQSQLASYADALRSAAAVDPDRTFIAYVGFIKANQMWLAHSSLEQHGSEAQRRAAEDVADVLAVIVKARTDRGQAGLDAEMTSVLKALADAGYGDLVRLATSRVATNPTDRQTAAARALAAFHGDSYEPAGAAAIRTLELPRFRGQMDAFALGVR